MQLGMQNSSAVALFETIFVDENRAKTDTVVSKMYFKRLNHAVKV